MALTIYKPEYEDLWFKQMMMSDEDTMSYNHAWGGTIPFPEEKWSAWYDHWITNTEGKRFYRYLKNEDDQFIGEIAYHFDHNVDGYLADVVILSKNRGRGYGTQALAMLCSIAGENGIHTLYDDIAADNPAISLFLKQGFSEEYHTDEIVMLKKELNRQNDSGSQCISSSAKSDITVYYNDGIISIRNMKREDARVLYDTYLSYGWHPSIETYETYYREQEEGKRKVFIAEYRGEVAGICTLVMNPCEGPFAKRGYPEIVDLSVFFHLHKHGIGNTLLDIAENEAFKVSDTVYLAVGVHSGYGPAQRIYVKRGYNFDGSGVWYQGKQLEQYASCVNDDDLVLFMSKTRG